MTVASRPERDRRSLSRVLYDIAQLLESADASDDRLRRVLDHLRCAVPCDACALLEVRPASESRVLVEPRLPDDEQTALVAALGGLFARCSSERKGVAVGSVAGRPPKGSPTEAATLAVPLVGGDEVIGVLLVRRASGAYAACHLRVLAVVAGQLGAYLSMVRAYDQIRERTGELDEARRSALVANRAKDELLAVVSHELKDPVASTLAWAHILSDAGADPVKPARAAAAIERNARSLAKLIDAIQGLACVASAEQGLDLRAVERASVLKEAIEELRAIGKGTPAYHDSDHNEPTRSSVWQSGAPEPFDPVPPGVPPIATSPPTAARVPATARRLEGIRVLLVDDDCDIRDAFQTVLEHYGAAVTAVGSVSAALAAFDRERPDVLLSDLGMPGESGYDLMRQVAARDASLPAAALTAFGEIADSGRALAAGFRMQLGKPIETAALVGAVADLAGRPAREAPLQHAGAL